MSDGEEQVKTTGKRLRAEKEDLREKRELLREHENALMVIEEGDMRTVLRVSIFDL